MRLCVFGYGALPSVACSSMHFAYAQLCNSPTRRQTDQLEALQPPCDNGCRLSRHKGLGSSLFARHYSGSRGFFPFLWVLRCFSSPACLSAPYVFRYEYQRITTGGFPHSEIPGSKVGQHLTRAYRSRPRPSSALGAKASTVCPYSLDREEHIMSQLWSFQGAREPAPAQREDRAIKARSLKTQQQSSIVEVDVDSRRAWLFGRIIEAMRFIDEPGSHRSNCSGIPRKEVIQPQLPLRLPCYDFTPIIDPTFDGSLPCGLGHRLRVLPTFVV